MQEILPETRIIDLTVGQLTSLMTSVVEEKLASISQPQKEAKQYYGLDGICRLFNCSMVTAQRIKNSGKIDKAITQIGRKIVINAPLALELAKQSNLTIKRK